MNEIESKSKPRRAQGGKGLLSHQISVQKSQQSIPLFPREEREEEKRGRRGTCRGRWRAVQAREKREPERVRGG